MVLITIKSGNDPQFLFDVPAKEGGETIISIPASLEPIKLYSPYKDRNRKGSWTGPSYL